MSATPSLRRRVVAAAIGVFVATLVVTDLAVAATHRTLLERHLQEVLDQRVAIVRALGDLPPRQLADALARHGLRATVRPTSGPPIVVAPPSPRLGGAIPGPSHSMPRRLVSAQVALPRATVVVRASADGVDHALRQLRRVQLVVAAVAVTAALVLLVLVTATALRPLDRVVAHAERIRRGHLQERLAPDRPHTELGRAAAALDRMLDRLEEAIGEATAAEARSRRFLADAAHQLRGPLTAAQASMAAWRGCTDPSAADRLAAAADREVTRAGHLAHNLLRLARLDAEQPLPLVVGPVTDVVEHEVARTADLAAHLSVELDVVLPVPPVARCPAALAEVLANLLDNARRHACTRIVVRVRSRGGFVVLRVADDGPGVPPALADRLFERFAAGGGEPGAGLGLAIARELARAHGGDLRHRQPSLFVLTLPAAHADPAGSTGADEEPAQVEVPA